MTVLIEMALHSLYINRVSRTYFQEGLKLHLILSPWFQLKNNEQTNEQKLTSKRIA